MVDPKEVSRQLKKLGARFQFWCRPEIRELPKILFEQEQIKHILVIWYEGGFALLCATDVRVLLVDKKPFYLTIEDVRYDMISEVQYDHRLINATLRIGTVHKTVAFTAYNHEKLREFTNHIQEQVTMYRQQQNPAANQQSATTGQSPVTQTVTQQNPQLQTAPGGGTLRPLAYKPAPVVASPSEKVVSKLAGLALKRPQKNVVNPYNMPVMIRRRVSRFY